MDKHALRQKIRDALLAHGAPNDMLSAVDEVFDHDTEKETPARKTKRTGVSRKKQRRVERRR